MPRWWWLATVAVAALVRAALAPGKGFPTDIETFQQWAVALVQVGPIGLYANETGHPFPVVDYPPGYLYVLWLVGRLVVAAYHGTPRYDLFFKFAIKVPAMLADFGVAALAYAIAKRVVDRRRAFFAFAGLLLLPPLWLVSAYWGQVDSVASLLLLGTIALVFTRRSALAWTVFGATVLIKPQSLAIAPVVLVWDLRAGGRGKGLPIGIAGALVLAYASALPFTTLRAPADVLRWLVQRYVNGVGKYPNSSSGAFNLYTVAGKFFAPDSARVAGVTLQTWGVVLFAAIALAVAIKLWTVAGDGELAGRRAFVAATFVLLAALFIVTTRMHERYFMPAVVLGTIAACFDRRYLAIAVAFYATFTINCAFILVGFYGGSHHPITLTIGHALSILNVGAFAIAVAAFVRTSATRTRDLRSESENLATASLGDA
ncbi:MAG: hypothetical protein NVS3B17_06300 [Vulcanimicrobiaceae bacterium]